MQSDDKSSHGPSGQLKRHMSCFWKVNELFGLSWKVSHDQVITVFTVCIQELNKRHVLLHYIVSAPACTINYKDLLLVIRYCTINYINISTNNDAWLITRLAKYIFKEGDTHVAENLF